MRRLRRWAVLLVAGGAILTAAAPPVRASVGLYVGRNLTADGSVLLGGYGDEPSSHWLVVVPRRKHPPGTTIEVGATGASRFPGVRTRIPQVTETFKYLTVQYSAFAGFPAPLENGGLNEYGVAARDISCGSRAELRAMTPNPQRGLSYSDFSRAALERARSAREAARIVGELCEQYGEATYGGNSHLFADAQEGWVVVELAGGKNLWFAARLGPDEVRVVRGGCGFLETGEIEVPADFPSSPNFMGARNLVSFAVEQGWYDPKSGKPLSLNRTYLSHQTKPEAERQMEQILRASAPRMTVEQMIDAVRNPLITRESAGYGQVAHLRAVAHPDLATTWFALASSITSPFIPFRVGVEDVPPEFKRHRYLTEGEAERFIAADQIGLESSRSAFLAFKRLFYLTCPRWQLFRDEVVTALRGFEGRRVREAGDVERTAQRLYDAGEARLARRYLTYYSSTEALEGLRLTESLTQSLEARIRALFGGEEPATGLGEGGILYCRDRDK